MAETQEKGTNITDFFRNIFFYFSEMDIPSQKFGLFWGRIIITIATIVFTVIGYFSQQFWHTVAGISITTLLVIAVFSPAWPCFKKQSLKFLDEQTKAKKTT